MTSSTDSKRLEETKLKDVEAKENENPNKNQSENETENEDRPLQIDTGSVTKAETCEAPAKEEEQTNRKKRSMDSSTDSNTTPTKKVRSKPKPQIIENMKEYLDNNTIEKLTTTTLLHWLRERNLHCSTRDKKAELIQKVKKHFTDSKS